MTRLRKSLMALIVVISLTTGSLAHRHGLDKEEYEEVVGYPKYDRDRRVVEKYLESLFYDK